MDLNDRLSKLQEVGTKLKGDFIGLDHEIDKILDNIKIWYCMPEVLTRPVIVNLWGMTGTGKTDLVRKLVKYLEFSHKFLEIQMDTDLMCGYTKVDSLKKAFLYSDIEKEEQGVVLLDEFQRFNSKDPLSGNVKQERYGDTWMLLSDGVFNVGATTYESDYNELMFDMQDRYEFLDKCITMAKEAKGKGKKENIREAEENLSKPIELYYAKYVKKSMSLKESVADIKKLNLKGLISLCKENFDRLVSSEGGEYEKTLIFVCGNLDDAYSMSANVADADVDADMLHKYSRNINVVDIKKSLFCLFRPEQVSRLGSNHVIYPCLSSSNYRDIIRKNLRGYQEKIFEAVGVPFEYSEGIVALLYKNFVFPAQGVRPVFSGVNSFLSKVSPPLLFYSINEKDKAGISLRADGGVISAAIKGETLKVEYEFDIDIIKSNICTDKKVIYGVHEAGHALVYALLFKWSPKFINTEITNFDGAYIIPNDLFNNKKNSLDTVKVYLAGTVAEEIVAGEMLKTSGCSSDISRATADICRMVRKLGMDSLTGNYCYGNEEDVAYSGITDFDKTNIIVEKMLNDCMEETKTLLNDNRHLLIELTDELLKVKKMNSEEFYTLMAKHIPGLQFVEPLDFSADEEIIDNYEEKYEEFKGTMINEDRVSQIDI